MGAFSMDVEVLLKLEVPAASTLNGFLPNLRDLLIYFDQISSFLIYVKKKKEEDEMAYESSGVVSSESMSLACVVRFVLHEL
jgi:hypothetical protein